jgi:ribosome-associated protein
MIQDVEVREVPVELYKVLKIASLAASGGEAKYVVSEGMVKLNGVVETQKRKKVGVGDEITFGDTILRVSLKAS